MVDRLRNEINTFRSLYDTVTKFLTELSDNHDSVWFIIYIVDYAGTLAIALVLLNTFSSNILFEIRLKRLF